ncbi:GspE/PulE family protein [Aureimonas sp. AU4]|uniref:GspE/PulE family protein n=1 Tax=Aureimonas sp. AU4 TaxID=1638163 RepID=UPI000706CDB5|nr:ATPase, T2SS/T4P/T4SS family [Aureimonas sp. AU4]BAT30580.1 type II secretion system protein E [Aureimonas sp. AU4]
MPATPSSPFGEAGPEAVWRNGEVQADALANNLSAHYGLPRLDFETVAGCPSHFGELSRRFLRESYIYPFQGADGTVRVALADPTRRDALRALNIALGQAAEPGLLSFEEIDLLFERALQREEPDASATMALAEPEGPPSGGEAAEDLKDLARGAPIVRLIDRILERAVELGATDIHLETERDHLSVRYRVDGFLRRDQKVPVHLAPAIVSRVKILSGLDIAERRLPQDGRANLRVGSVEADLRVAVMPTIHGETAVLRLLVKDPRLLDFGRIGMSSPDQRAFETLLSEPHGIVIVTGPTGSGKTTTLATAISLLNDPARKIVTVEDPIEYQIPGIHQTQIKPQIGLSFAIALRSFLRHDPDVIMVGEMRDRETVGIGIQAALTGHLVLTTLHTNSAADAVVRLLDMGVERYLIGASLRGILGQRLVRRLCERCRRPDGATAEAARSLMVDRGLRCEAADTFFAPGGCDICGQTGYRGRVGIFELLRMDAAFHAQVRDIGDAGLILLAARNSGMRTMLEDGLDKCAAGLTSFEEVLRATG